MTSQGRTLKLSFVEFPKIDNKQDRQDDSFRCMKCVGLSDFVSVVEIRLRGSVLVESLKLVPSRY